MIEVPHMILVPSSASHRLYASREILNVWPIHSLDIPCLCMLLVVIIQEYFSMIPFLIPAGIFLIFNATDKNCVGMYSMLFNIGVLLEKLGLVCSLGEP
jgi:hypothetical protein